MKNSIIITIIVVLVLMILLLLPGKSITIVTDPEKAADTELYNQLLQEKARLLAEKVDMLRQEVEILRSICPLPDGPEML